MSHYSVSAMQALQSSHVTLQYDCLQICVPAAFFALMWIPRAYIQPVNHGQYVPSSSIDIESKAWSGLNPYSGPAVTPAGGGRAHILLALENPSADASKLEAFATVLSKALACPRDVSSWTCPSPVVPFSFHCMFVNRTAGPQCKVNI